MPTTRDLTPEEAAYVSKQGIDPSSVKITIPDSNSSALAAGGRSALASALPTLAGGAGFAGGLGLGGMAAGALGLAPETMGTSLLALPFGMAGAYAASKLVGSGQEALLPDSAKQQLAQDQAQHPIATTVGSLATMPLGGMNPNPKGLIRAAGAIPELLGGSVSQAGRQALMNVAGGATLGAVQDIAQSKLEGRDIDWKSVGLNAALGSTFNSPNRLGVAMGFHPLSDRTVDNPDRLAATLNNPLPPAKGQVVNAPEPGVGGVGLPHTETLPDVTTVGGLNPNLQSEYDTKKQSGLAGFGMNREAPETQVGNMENEGGELKETPESNTPQETIKQKNDYVSSTLDKILGQTESIPRLPDRYQEEEPSTKSELQQRVEQELKNRGLSTSITPEYLDAVTNEVIKKNGLTVQTDDTLTNTEGKPVKGTSYTGQNKIAINPNLATADTPIHEDAHQLWLTLPDEKKAQWATLSQPELDKINKGRLGQGKKPWDTEEFFASQQGIEFLDRQLNLKNETPFKRWWNDVVALNKDKWSTPTIEQARRAQNFRTVNEARSPLQVQGGTINRNQELNGTGATPEDIKKYNDLGDRFNQLISEGKMDTPEFQQVWKDREAVKNKYGGHVPRNQEGDEGLLRRQGEEGRTKYPFTMKELEKGEKTVDDVFNDMNTNLKNEQTAGLHFVGEDTLHKIAVKRQLQDIDVPSRNQKNQEEGEGLDKDSPFTTRTIQLLSDPKKHKTPINNAGAFNGNQLLGFLKNQLSPTEMSVLQDAGIEKELSNRIVNQKDALKWVKENGPKVEVRKFGLGNLHKDSREFSQLQHWYDGLNAETKRQFEQAKSKYFSDANEYALGEEARRVSTNDEMANKLQRYAQLYRAGAGTRETSSTSHWQSIAPKPESKMPGYTEIAVTKPLGSRIIPKDKNNPYSFEDSQGNKRVPNIEPQFPSSHNFPPNTLGFARGYMETLPNGKKVFHVIEVQSDWAQQLQHEKENLKNLDPDLAEMQSKETLRRNDPLLPHYERLLLKAVIDHARSQGADAIAVSDAETAMMTEGHDRVAVHDIRTEQRQIGTIDYLERKYGKGMRLHYDQTLPKIASELTGSKGEPVEFEGQHKSSLDVQTGQPRKDLIFRNADSTPKTGVSARMYDLSNVKNRLESGDKFTLFNKFQEADDQKPWDKEGIDKSTWYRRQERLAVNPNYQPHDTIRNTPSSERLLKEANIVHETDIPRIRKIVNGVLNRRMAQKNMDSFPNGQKRSEVIQDITQSVVADLSKGGLDTDGIEHSAWRRADSHIQRLLKGEEGRTVSLQKEVGENKTLEDVVPQQEQKAVESQTGSTTAAAQLIDKLEPMSSHPTVSKILDDLYEMAPDKTVDVNEIAKKYGLKFQEGDEGLPKVDRSSPEKEHFTTTGLYKFLRVRPEMDVAEQKSGDKGKQAGAALRQFYPDRDRLYGKYMTEAQSGNKNLSDTDRTRVLNTLIQEDTTGNVLRENLGNAKQKALYDGIRSSLLQKQQDQIADKQPVRRYDKQGKPYEDQAKINPTYFPSRLRPEVMEEWLENPNSAKSKQWKQSFLKHQVDQGNSLEVAKKQLDDLIASVDIGKPNATKFGAVRMQEGVGLPAELRSNDLMKTLNGYFNRVSTDRAFWRQVESKPEIQNLLNPKNEEGVAHEFAGIVDHIKGEAFDKDANQLRAFNRLATSLMLGPLTNVHIALSTMANTLQYINPIETAAVYSKALSRWSDARRESLENGYARKDMQSLKTLWDGTATTVEKLQAASATIGKINGRQAVDSISKTFAQAVGDEVVSRRLVDAKNGDTYAQNLIRKLDPSWTPEKSYDQKGISQLGSVFASYIHGAHDSRTLPAWMNKETIVQPFFSLMSWSIAQTNAWMKNVWEPATRGNMTPLLMSTLGAAFGGYAIQQLRQKVLDKKSSIPALEEIVNSSRGAKGNIPLLAYNFMQMASFTGFAGIASVLGKDIFDLAYKNIPQGSTFPLDEVAGASVTIAAKAVGAWLQNPTSQNLFQIMPRAMSDLAKENIQSARIAANWGADYKVTGQNEAFQRKSNVGQSDLRRFKMVEGQPYDEQTPNANNPYYNLEQKGFKRTEDLRQAASQVPSLLNLAYSRAQVGTPQFNPEVLKQQVSSLKQNSYQTMPSIENMPIQFAKYYQFLKQTQGEEVANARLKDYLKQNAVNRVKSQLIPSF